MVLALAAGCAGPTDEELKQRVAVSRDKFDWNDYSEHLKGFIGAGPVAEWAGTPVDARVEGCSVVIRFRLTGPWATRNIGIPIMIREPRGATFTSCDVRPADGLIAYRFTFPAPAATPPWLEMKYPRGQIRLAFQRDGTWRATF